jgi:hypothetical protein
LEAVVEEIWILHDSDRPEKVSDFYSTNLRYGGEGTRFIDLNPGRRIAWNIGHISAKAHQAWHEKAIFHDVTPAKKGHLRFLLDLVEYPNGQANCFPPGDYAIKIVFYSVNANRVEQWLKIQWTGQWRSSPVDMFDEIIITPIPALDEWLEKKAA